jgi:hypothetical protein
MVRIVESDAGRKAKENQKMLHAIRHRAAV